MLEATLECEHTLKYTGKPNRPCNSPCYGKPFTAMVWNGAHSISEAYLPFMPYHWGNNDKQAHISVVSIQFFSEWFCSMVGWAILKRVDTWAIGSQTGRSEIFKAFGAQMMLSWAPEIRLGVPGVAVCLARIPSRFGLIFSCANPVLPFMEWKNRYISSVPIYTESKAFALRRIHSKADCFKEKWSAYE